MPDAPNRNSNTKSKPAGYGNQAKQWWPTPTTEIDQGRASEGRRKTPSLRQVGPSWMTPSVSNSQGNQYTRDRGQAGLERPTLSGQANQFATHWPTPAANEFEGGDPAKMLARREREKAKGRNGNGFGLSLGMSVSNWPTPTSTDGGANSNRDQRGNVGADLKERVNSWPTPASRDYRSPNLDSYEDRGGGSKGEQLNNYVAHHFSLPPAQPTPDGQPSSPTAPNSPRHLNPLFAAWLMGWPSTWVIAEPHASSASATALWRSRLRQRLSCLLDGADS